MPPSPPPPPAVAPTRVRGRLDRLTDLPALATQTCYSGVGLARACGVSLRHLQRHIHQRHAQTLGEWLNTLRLGHGYQRLTQGCSVKEAAYSLGYKQVSHFCRCFKNHYGFTASTVPISSRGENAPPPPVPPAAPAAAPRQFPTQARASARPRGSVPPRRPE